jgi:beta-lactamase class A
LIRPGFSVANLTAGYPAFSVDAEIFDVDVAAETGVEQPIPARVRVVIADLHRIAFPLPIAATVKIVPGHDPIGVVVEKDVASPVINAARCAAGVKRIVLGAVSGKPYNPPRGGSPLRKKIPMLLALLALTSGGLPWCASAEQSPPEKEQILWQKLAATINEVDGKLDGVLAVAILDLSTGQKYLLHADEVMPTASSIKIAILAELFRQAQQGKVKLTDFYTLQPSDMVGGSGITSVLTPGMTRLTLRDVAGLMISVSDNSAANVIIDRIGMDHVNALLDSWGLTRTRLRRKMMDLKAATEGKENVATPREMALLLENLYRGKVLNTQMTDSFFSLLSVHKESYIPRNLPEDVRVANKSGELEGVRNDSGIVFAGKRPYVISVMTAYLRRERDGGEAITKISDAAYQMFDRLGRASEWGRVISPHDTGNP